MNQNPADRGNTKLCLIGNGFDLFHGVDSAYSSFRSYLRRKDPALSMELDSFFECKNLWADFEDNLACLSRSAVMEQVDDALESGMTTMDESDDDFLYADYYSSLERGTGVVSDLTETLPLRFRKWVERLSLPAGNRKRLSPAPDPGALYITFNYTEFAEVLYGIPKERILYLHGDRRDKDRPLILGHGRDPEKEFDNWRTKHRNDPDLQPYRRGKKGRRYQNSSLPYLAYFQEDDAKSSWRSPIRYYAAESAAGTIEEYYDKTAKHTQQVLAENAAFFHSLKDVESVIVIGHSLSPVDYPYFKQIIRENKAPGAMRWKISVHNGTDRKKAARLLSEMRIDSNNAELFQL